MPLQKRNGEAFMKKLIALLFILLIGYSVFFDVTKGTLPSTDSIPVTTNSDDKALPSYKEIKIKSGDTLLTIMEREEGKLVKPINTIMLDFQELNDGVSPHELQIGKTYKFPIYSESQ